MGVVQIEQSELDLLRKERDDARTELSEAKAQVQEAERDRDTKVEAAEAAKAAAETERDNAKTELASKNEELASAELKTQRMDALGEGFVAKLGDTTKTRLQSQAASMKDDEWDARLTELEESFAAAGLTLKRDAAKDGSSTPPDETANKDTLFTGEEVASAGASLGGSPAPATATVGREDTKAVVGKLAGAFAKKS